MSGAGWIGPAAFWLLLFALLTGELIRPLHRRPREARGRLVANFGLGLLNFSLFALLPLSTVAAAALAQRDGIGAMNLLAIPVAAAFVATLLLRSLAAYLLHRLAHAVPALWRMHRVHHADIAVDLSTGVRHHPLELLFVAAVHALIAVAFGLSPTALAAYEAAAVALALWTHANLRLPAGIERAAALLLVTPALHHVHHSARQSETDSNFGEVLSVWDRLFGSYRRLDDDEIAAMPIGLGAAHDRTAADLAAQLALPFRTVSRDPSPRDA